MKKILHTLAILAVTGLTFTSCSKEYKPIEEDANINQTNPLKGEFSCELYDGGLLYNANEKIVLDVTDNGVRTLSVSTKEYSKNLNPKIFNTISFSISNFQGVGTYPIDYYTTFQAIIRTDTLDFNTYNQINNLPETFINITKAENDEYEGEFQLRVQSTRDTSTIMINKGKFKLKK